LICLRAEHGKNFGTLLIPEGLLIHLPKIKSLIEELNKLFTKLDKKEALETGNRLVDDQEFVKTKLSAWSAAVFNGLPEITRKQLVTEREAHGTIQLSQIETEKLLSILVEEELKKRKANKTYKGSFSPVTHFFGYQGRCAFPSKFDCELAATYGFLAGALIQHGITGYCVTCRGLTDDVNDWYCAGIPLTAMTVARSKSSFGENKAIISSSEVNLSGKIYGELQQQKGKWTLADHYSNPGPQQYFGPMADVKNISLQIAHGHYPQLLKKLEQLTDTIKIQCRFGAPEEVLNIALMNLENLDKMLEVMKTYVK